jgi:hypothetical protein
MFKFWKNILKKYESALAKLPSWLSPWVRDFVDVGLTVLTIIIVLKVIFQADMIVPLVVVTSDSMVHETGDNSWETWITSRGITKDKIDSFPLSNGFNMGDMILVRDPKAVLGDVIIYERDLDHLTFASKDPIIHRVIGVAHVKDYRISGTEGILDCFNVQTLQSEIDMVRRCQATLGNCSYTRYPKTGNFSLFITKGDHNAGSDQCNARMNIAYPVTDAQVTGRALLRLPYLGWPKMALNILIRIVTFQF